MPTEPMIRPGRDADEPGFIALIGACWSQYPGVLLDVDGEMPELRALATYYGGQGGAIWVAGEPGAMAGMIATRPLDDGSWEICRVYVHPDLHGAGLGHRLLDIAEAHAIAAGARRLKLWSDTRFDRAHRFYEKRSYIRSGPIRVLHDISNSLEFAYAKPVDGIEILDAASAGSAEYRFDEILTACAGEGIGLTFQPALTHGAAQSFWAAIAKEVAAGRRIVLAGWSGGVLAGVVTLRLPTAADQSHRGEIELLLIDPPARRRGLAGALMQRAEQAASTASRTHLMLSVRAGSPAEAMFRETGWQAAGTIPGYAKRADGTLDDAVFFWKRLA